MSKGIIDPTLALSVVMESAIPMSKVDLDDLQSLQPIANKAGSG